MDNIISPEFQQLVIDIPGAEGPVLSKDGRLFMVGPEVMDGEQFSGELYQIDVDKKKKCLITKLTVDGFGGIPAGLQCDESNQLWLADMRLGLLKVSLGGEHHQVTKVDSDGRNIQGCNDCIFDWDGNLWITAPAGEIAPSSFKRSDKEPFGSFYCLPRKERLRGNHTLIRQERGLLFPNGIAVQHDCEGKPHRLIVAETQTKSLWAYDILGPAKISNKTLWATLPGNHDGGPDGMDFDESGNLLVANWGGKHIEVFGHDGSHFGRIACPFNKPSNVHFHPNSPVVYVTEHDTHGIWKFQWLHKGAKQYCEL